MMKNDLYLVYGETEINHLRKRDKKLGAVIDQIGVVDQDGIIKRKVNPDVFSSLIQSIISQQISSKGAYTVCQKLEAISGLDAFRLHALTAREIQACGMSMRKAEYVKGIADAVVTGAFDIGALSQMSDADVIRTLSGLKGVGVWTAEMLLIFSLMRPDVVSYGDLAIRRGMMKLYGLRELSKDQFFRYAKRYAPYGTVASLYLWHISSPDFLVDAKRKKLAQLPANQ